jgi:hypothetical protein
VSSKPAEIGHEQILLEVHLRAVLVVRRQIICTAVGALSGGSAVSLRANDYPIQEGFSTIAGNSNASSSGVNHWRLGFRSSEAKAFARALLW